MRELRTKVEANVRRSRVPSYEVTRQVSDLAMAVSECTRKLSLLRVRVFSAYPSAGELAGGTFIAIRGASFMATPRTAKVWFGAKEATTVRVTSDSEIVAEVPPQDVEGFVELRVVFEPGGPATVPYGFTYLAPPKPKKRR